MVGADIANSNILEEGDYMRKKVFFPNLEAELKRQGYTQEAYAKKIGLTPSSISYRMNGKVDFSLSEMIATSDLLKKKMDYLFRD